MSSYPTQGSPKLLNDEDRTYSGNFAPKRVNDSSSESDDEPISPNPHPVKSATSGSTISSVYDDRTKSNPSSQALGTSYLIDNTTEDAFTLES